MQFQNASLKDINKKYANKRPINIKIIDILFFTYIFILLCYLAFCLIFVQAQVIGTSMQPTYNVNLSQEDFNNQKLKKPELTYEQYIMKSKYKDTVFANKLDKGSNGDIVIMQTKTETVIKRIIATEGQQLTLEKDDFSGYFYFYLTKDNYSDKVKIDESYLSSSARAAMDFDYYEKFRQNNSKIITEESFSFYTTITIPKGQVFVLGDNREVSEDSSSYGTVSAKNIIGKVVFSYKYNQTFLGYIWQQICSIF